MLYFSARVHESEYCEGLSHLERFVPECLPVSQNTREMITALHCVEVDREGGAEH
jgi:hypothetical protein